MGSHDHLHEHEHEHGHKHDHHDHCSDHETDSDNGIQETKDAIRRRGVLKRLYQASALCTCFIIVEVTGGLISHSLAILSDAAHLFADLASFGVAIAASYLASMPATREHTYGLKRTESLAALFSMISLAFVSVGLGYEAVNRLIDPPEELVQGKVMSGIATIGVFVNIALALVLGEDHVHLPGAHDHDHGGHDHGHDHGLHSQCSGGYELLASYQKQHSGGDHSHDHHHNDAEEGHSHANCDHSNNHNGHNDGHYHDHDHGHGHEHAKKNNTVATPYQHEHVELHSDEVAVECPSAADERNINLHAAYLHVMADLAQSVAVLIAGLVIWARPDWYVIDPILTLLFAVLVLYSTVGVLKSSIAVLLEATPSNISWHKVYKAISQVPNVTDVHDLHLWSISHGQPSLSVHCRSDDPNALRNIRDKCLAFGISHVTIQIQPTEGTCLTCGDMAYCTSHLT